ncbi:MAG: protocatechuate 3,4-dioxygenase subunit alpha [Gaiellaceae bacterium]
MRTPSQTVGPFYAIGLCRGPDNELDPDGVELAGRLLDGRGEPIADGLVELWDPAGRRWGRCGTEDGGRFSFRVPRVPHLEVTVFARGLLRHQLTRVYLEGEPPAGLERLVAEHGEGVLRFDIHMQGENATPFFEH